MPSEDCKAEKTSWALWFGDMFKRKTEKAHTKYTDDYIWKGSVMEIYNLELKDTLTCNHQDIRSDSQAWKLVSKTPQAGGPENSAPPTWS